MNIRLTVISSAVLFLAACGGGNDPNKVTDAITGEAPTKDTKILAVKRGQLGTYYFGRLFNLPGFAPDSAALNDLGSPAGQMFDPNLPENDNPTGEPSGFTYFAQFVDHDMTLNRQPLVDAPVAVETLENSRQPSLNLDSVFGGGPDVNPELFDAQGHVILSLNGRDHQRLPNGTAVLVEGRNDENEIVSQIHVAVARFHNAMIDRGMSFDTAREATTLHYEWIVLNDFLPRIVGRENVDKALRGEIGLYDVTNPNQKVMPVEFAVAAYRFGHSIVRKAYVLGADQLVKTQVFNGTNDLRGARPLPAGNIIQWSNFFEVPGTANPQPPVNVSRKIDTLLSSGLFTLPSNAIPSGGTVVLAQRNLIRGKSLGLPSGQAIATAMGLKPLTNEQIGLVDPRFKGEAPLWFYILGEAQVQQNGERLGAVGSAIVADVMVGLLKKDKTGLLNGKNKDFVPLTGPSFRMGDFLKIAGVAS